MFENMQFAKLIINLRAGENCDVYAMRFPMKPHTQVGYNIDNLVVMISSHPLSLRLHQPRGQLALVLIVSII